METKINPRIVLPVTAIGLLVVLALIGSIVSLGNQLSSIHWIVGLIYYVLILALIIAGVVYPIVCTFGRPVFGLYKLYEGSPRSREKHLRMLNENLKRANLPSGAQTQLTGDMSDAATCAALFKASLGPVVDGRIKSAAKTSFTTTAISQTPAFDMISVMAVNLRMVKAIVADCGYRPSAPALLGLYMRVMKVTLLAGGLEEMDFEEVVALIGGNAALTASSVVLSSAAQGAANAFLTVRVGVITKAMLFAEDGPVDMRKLRRASYGEALSFLKSCGLLDDVRRAMASVAGAARDAAVAKAVDMRDAAMGHVSDLRDGTVEKLAGFAESTAGRMSGIKESIVGRIADRPGKRPRLQPQDRAAEEESPAPARQSGYTQAASQNGIRD